MAVPGGANTPPGPLSAAVAALILDAFNRASLSQRQMAAIIGVSKSQMNRLLNGLVVLNIEQLDAICHELGLSAVEVVDAADFATRDRFDRK